MGHSNHYLAIEGEAKDWEEQSGFVDRRLQMPDTQTKLL